MDKKRIIRINKIVYPGINSDSHKVYCTIAFADNNLSIVGVEGPRKDGDCLGSAGQIHIDYRDNLVKITEYAKGWDADTWNRFIMIWDEYHLNDMISHCEHVDLDEYFKLIDVEEYTVTAKYYNLDTIDKRNITKILDRNKCNNSSEFKAKSSWDLEMLDLLELGYIKLNKVYESSAHLIYYDQHPEGYLNRECLECGYKQGTSWLRKEVPSDVLEFLDKLPEQKSGTVWDI